jgi:RNA polymerase sigma-70 factor (ECF subfamily)
VTARRTTPPASVPRELLDAARGGDQRAFEAVFATYQPGLVRYLRSTAPDLADDVAAATWTSVAASLDRFRGDGIDFRRWLFTIARRRLVDEFRRGSRRPLHVAEVPDLPDEAPGPAARWDGPDWAAWALRQIPARQAEVVSLRILGALSVAETAELLGITSENVRVLSHRGLVAIQRLLEDAGVTPQARTGTDPG